MDKCSNLLHYRITVCVMPTCLMAVQFLLFGDTPFDRDSNLWSERSSAKINSANSTGEADYDERRRGAGKECRELGWPR